MSLPFKSSSDWISRASLIGLCDLSLHIHTDTFERLFPFILSLPSLQSLEIHCFDIDNIRNYSFKPLIPATFLLKDLKKLHLKAKVSCSDLTLFMAQQTRLEYLYFEPVLQSTIELSSQTLKVLKIISSGLEPVSVNLSFPRLEFLELKMQVTILLQDFQGEMPLLRWAVVKLSNAIVGGAPAIGSMLRSIANVKELTLHTGYLLPSDIPPFHMLTEPGKELPAFPNLRSIKLSTCFHEEGIQDLICLLQNSPVLETVKLDHVDMEFDLIKYRRRRKNDGSSMPISEMWKSKLPYVLTYNDNEHAYFTDLHTGNTKIELIKLLCEGHSSKKQKL